eukprot:8809414-Heterocapsa_arctica.AAC.1
MASEILRCELRKPGRATVLHAADTCMCNKAVQSVRANCARYGVRVVKENTTHGQILEQAARMLCSTR